MPFASQLADIRFGCGLSPVHAPPVSAAQMVAGLKGPDTAAQRFPIETFEFFQNRIAESQRLAKLRRTNRGSPEALASIKERRVLNKAARIAQGGWLGQHFNRWIWTDAPLRERLSHFWADHFTATGKAGVIRRAGSPYMEDAIRPRITGLFEDMLMATVLHPLMIHYLDQQKSIGPNSARAVKMIFNASPCSRYTFDQTITNDRF